VLVELEFVTEKSSRDGEFRSLTDGGMVAAGLLWFERRFGDPSEIFEAPGGG
jgi:hypothetical protein